MGHRHPWHSKKQLARPDWSVASVPRLWSVNADSGSRHGANVGREERGGGGGSSRGVFPPGDGDKERSTAHRDVKEAVVRRAKANTRALPGSAATTTTQSLRNACSLRASVLPPPARVKQRQHLLRGGKKKGNIGKSRGRAKRKWRRRQACANALRVGTDSAVEERTVHSGSVFALEPG